MLLGKPSFWESEHKWRGAVRIQETSGPRIYVVSPSYSLSQIEQTWIVGGYISF